MKVLKLNPVLLLILSLLFVISCNDGDDILESEREKVKKIATMKTDRTSTDFFYDKEQKVTSYIYKEVGTSTSIYEIYMVCDIRYEENELILEKKHPKKQYPLEYNEYYLLNNAGYITGKVYEDNMIYDEYIYNDDNQIVEYNKSHYTIGEYYKAYYTYHEGNLAQIKTTDIFGDDVFFEITPSEYDNKSNRMFLLDIEDSPLLHLGLFGNGSRKLIKEYTYRTPYIEHVVYFDYKFDEQGYVTKVESVTYYKEFDEYVSGETFIYTYGEY
jgi:hypothetical protein